MINLTAGLISNGAAFLLLFTLLFNMRKTFFRKLPDDRIFMLMILLNLLQCFFKPLTLYVDGKLLFGFRTISVIANTLLFINNILFALLWAMYADIKLFGDVGRLKRIYRYLGIPAFLVILGAVCNLFFPVFFTVSPENVYQRAGIFIFPYIVSYFYLVYGVVLIYVNKNKVNKYLFLPAVFFLIPILIASVVQFLFYGLSLLWIGGAIALTSVYINVQNESACIDTLSGLYSRPYMNRYLSSLIRRSTADKRVAGIMLDVDRFKSINDTYGHLVGDEVIRSVGDILRSSISTSDLAVRFAGDEFVIIETVSEEKEVQETVGRIRKNIEVFNASSGKVYQIFCSVGYSIYDPSRDTMDTFLIRIDEEMYREKNEKKRQLQEQMQ